jgi:PAB-dependent poly(A)-specific ribonuclease subunit 2
MHYLLHIRRVAKSHIATNCPREHCLLCELGFVARMLEDAKGINCQASNFCKTVGVLAQGRQLSYLIQSSPLMDVAIAQNLIELIDYGRDSAGMDYAQIIQSFHRFLVDHLIAEGNSPSHNPLVVRSSASTEQVPALAPVSQLLGINATTIFTCINCKSIRSKENITHVMDIIYPRKVGIIRFSSLICCRLRLDILLIASVW